MGKINAGVMSSASDEWATPDNLFAVLDRDFLFVLDAAATAENAKCSRFFTAEDDALSQDWPRYRSGLLRHEYPISRDDGAIWLNPPYSQIGAFMAKAHAEAMAGSLVVCLVPARTDTRWWWSYAVPAVIRFLPGRLKFGDGRNSAPFPSAIVVMWPGLLRRGVMFWDWKQEAKGERGCV